MRLQTIRGSFFWAAAAALSAAIAGPACAAQPEAVTKIYVVEVPPAMDHAFREGMRSWVHCLEAHQASFVLRGYTAASGDLNRYAFLEERRSWADLDTEDPAAKACDATFLTDVVPHFSKSAAEFAQPTAKISYMPADAPGTAPIVWVDAYRFKPGHKKDFIAFAAKFSAAAAKAHFSQPYIGYEVFGAGYGGEELLLVSPGSNWAQIGADPSPVPEKMMEEAYGKKAAQAMHEKAMASVAGHWADAWRYEKSLSYSPAH